MQVLFSSVAALLGSPGQANYAAANACLDAHALSQTQSGLPGIVSVQWGAWAGSGMAARDAGTALRVQRSGMALLTASQGLAALEGVLAQAHRVSANPPSILAAVPFNWETFMGSQKMASSPFFGEFAQMGSGGAQASSGTSGLGVSKRSAEELTLELQERVKSAVVAILGSEVGETKPLMAAGLDSLGSVELRNALEASLGLELPGTVKAFPISGARIL